MYIISGDYMKIFKIFVIVLIIGFLGLFFAYTNGYSEKFENNKMILTNEKIEEFEKDILNNENISLESYLDIKKDYSTKTSDMTLNLSSKLENLVDNSIKYIFRKLSGMIE